jgi:hypothetical protein
MGDIFTTIVSIQPSGSTQPETGAQADAQSNPNGSGSMSQGNFATRRKRGVSRGEKAIYAPPPPLINFPMVNETRYGSSLHNTGSVYGTMVLEQPLMIEEGMGHDNAPPNLGILTQGLYDLGRGFPQVEPGSFTVMTWVMMLGLHWETQWIMGKADSPWGVTPPWAIRYYYSPTLLHGHLICQCRSSNMAVSKQLDDALEFAVWTHIAMSFTPTRFRIYKDGIKVWEQEGNFGALNYGTHGPIFICGPAGSVVGPQTLHGRLDDIRLYDEELPESVVLGIKQST